MFKISLIDSSVTRNLKKLDANTKTGIRKAFLLIGEDLKKASVNFVKNPPKTGIIYGRHQASAPGESPANRTGRLATSINFKDHSFNSLDFGADAPYSGFLEKGTAKIKPRPYLTRAIKARQKETIHYFEQQIKKAIK